MKFIPRRIYNKDFTVEELQDTDLLIYDPFHNKRTTLQIKRNGAYYNISVIDLFDTPKYDDYTVICVHGWGSNSLSYRFVLKYLSPYCRVVAYDIKGHGESDKGDDTYDLDLFTEELAQVIGHYNPKKLILIGHSMGSAIVLNYLFLNPGRAKAAVIISSSSDFKEPLPRVVPMVLSNIDEQVKNSIIQLVMTLNVTRECPKQLLDIIREQSKKTPYHVYRKALLNTIYAWKKDEDLKNIKEQILLIVGDKDIVTPLKQSMRLNELLPNSRLVIIPNAGHGILIEKGKHVALLIKEFIEFQVQQDIAKLTNSNKSKKKK